MDTEQARPVDAGSSEHYRERLGRIKEAARRKTGMSEVKVNFDDLRQGPTITVSVAGEDLTPDMRRILQDVAGNAACDAVEATMWRWRVAELEKMQESAVQRMPGKG